jgi:hypothetical protein
VDPDPQGSAFFLLQWIRVRFGNANPDLDPRDRKLTKVKKYTYLVSCLSKRLLYRTFVGVYFDLFPYLLKYISNVKFNFL